MTFCLTSIELPVIGYNILILKQFTSCVLWKHLNFHKTQLVH